MYSFHQVLKTISEFQSGEKSGCTVDQDSFSDSFEKYRRRKVIVSCSITYIGYMSTMQNTAIHFNFVVRKS